MTEMNPSKEKFIIKGLGGKKTLNGEIEVNGAKNAVLPIMASAVLFSDQLYINNVPNIEDVKRMSELMSGLGFKVTPIENHRLILDPKNCKKSELDYEISKRLRA